VKNISLDGWVIMCILILFAAFSWLVVFSKAFTFFLIGRENRAFAEPFSKLSDLYAIRNEEFENSSLYRVYLAGCEEVESRFGTPGKCDLEKKLTEKDMAAVRAALDRAYVQETQRLNAWMVVLTMAITGGPFLGLLGTVWGVMNTFAAMAEAGEANIMAIAPGVASALSTTVFGLIVAIPALFGYNYLASRVRNITTQLNVFIDQFAAKAEQLMGVEG
jgi:biopolymer transport protein ExbB